MMIATERTATAHWPRDEAPAAADRAEFVDAMSRAVTSVNIVTTDGGAGRFGVTVSAVASVSADPPMILACINRNSPAAAAVRENGVLCVNLLADSHAPLSDVFAGRFGPEARFGSEAGSWTSGASGAPQLIGAVAAFDCALETAVDAGSHTIFVGRVLSVSVGGEAPLAYCRRSYCTPSALPIAC
ncbi:FMN reductase (NADH) RutF [Hansschlegelia plantiphila]|uniref:FMN reductase (NADH) RutF n=2 Tax=Hansschlegelia plantiphila TaxID=374655 RepID=A0A9W6J409_9HYPH|nr:FMN reductase (NADH) RutF [Hansschlegelia plantiphila]